jgi:hypothetical protein
LWSCAASRQRPPPPPPAPAAAAAAAAADATAAQPNMAQSVVLMNFTAAPQHQWQFILAAIAQAELDQDLAAIAAGPMEHLLGHHGASFIDAIESRAAADATFARMLGDVRRYGMTDELWTRVQALQQPRR